MIPVRAPVSQACEASLSVVCVGARITCRRTAVASLRHASAAALVGNVLRIFFPSRLLYTPQLATDTRSGPVACSGFRVSVRCRRPSRIPVCCRVHDRFLLCSEAPGEAASEEATTDIVAGAPGVDPL